MLKIVALTLAAALIAGVVFLMVWDIPAPSAVVEKPVAYDQRAP